MTLYFHVRTLCVLVPNPIQNCIVLLRRRRHVDTILTTHRTQPLEIFLVTLLVSNAISRVAEISSIRTTGVVNKIFLSNVPNYYSFYGFVFDDLCM